MRLHVAAAPRASRPSCAGMPDELGDQLARPRRASSVAVPAPEVDRDQHQRRELRGEALVDATPISGPGVGVERAVRRARDRRVDHVADRQHRGAARSRLLDRRQRVGGLALLARSRRPDRRGRPPDRGSGTRWPGRPRTGCAPALSIRNLPTRRRVVRRAAREQHDAPRGLRVSSSKPSRSASSRLEHAGAPRSVSAIARGCSWISLSMKCLIAALLGLRRVPGDGACGRALDGRAVEAR